MLDCATCGQTWASSSFTSRLARLKPFRGKSASWCRTLTTLKKDSLQWNKDRAIGRVKIGRNQSLVFRETEEPLKPYDGHHIAIYVANFSRPYSFLKQRGLISEEVENHQFRLKDVIDPESGDCLFLLEHEVRSLRHPMFHRFFVNRDPAQSQRHYRRQRDALIPFSE